MSFLGLVFLAIVLVFALRITVTILIYNNLLHIKTTFIHRNFQCFLTPPLYHYYHAVMTYIISLSTVLWLLLYTVVKVKKDYKHIYSLLYFPMTLYLPIFFTSHVDSNNHLGYLLLSPDSELLISIFILFNPRNSKFFYFINFSLFMFSMYHFLVLFKCGFLNF